MLTAVFLLVSWAAGFAVITRALPFAPTIVRLPAGFLLSVVFTSWTTYLVAYALSGATDESLRVGMILSTLLAAVVLVAFGRRLRPRDLRLPLVDAVVTVVALVVSWWLMHERLRTVRDELIVSANTWGDTGLHVALSRSFSVGGNYPTQYPFFAGEPIRYHFGFDFFAGMLQKGGMSVEWSFNLPGIIGFSAMILTTFALARLLFGSPEKRPWRSDRGIGIGVVSVALLLTNQSLGWERYFQRDGHGNVFHALNPSVLWHHKDYLAIGPYSDDRIAIFNTLNPYLTQTHLITAVALILLLVFAVVWQLRSGEDLDRRVMVGAGVTFGASFWLNGVVWLAAGVFFGTIIVLTALGSIRRASKDAGTAGVERVEGGDDTATPRGAGRTRAISWLKTGAAFAVPALVLAVPQAIFLSGGSSKGGLSIHIGYLVCGSEHAGCHSDQMALLSPHDWWAFVQYWWLNEGLFIPLLILAFFLGTRRDKKIIAALTAIFVWGSLFTVGLDVGGQNHKTFNLWEVLSGPFAAFALVEIWIVGGRRFRDGGARKRLTGGLTRLAAVVITFFLLITGVIDAMTVKNDFTTGVFGDATTQETMRWIDHHTPPRASFLTDYDQLYTAATMAGRRVELGFSSWASSAGYDITARQKLIVAIYSAPDAATACSLLKANHIDYVLVGPNERTSTRFTLNAATFAQLTPATVIGTDANQNVIYRVASTC